MSILRTAGVLDTLVKALIECSTFVEYASVMPNKVQAKIADSNIVVILDDNLVKVKRFDPETGEVKLKKIYESIHDAMRGIKSNVRGMDLDDWDE